MKNSGILFLGAVLLCAGCAQEEVGLTVGTPRVLTADIATPSQTRSCVDGTTLSESFLGMLWEPGDEVGVYSNNTKNIKFTNTGTENSPKTTFEGTAKGTLQYAYYPWSAANDSRDAGSLLGSLPETQKIHANHHVDTDYKYGEIIGSGVDERVSFKHLMPLVRLELTGKGTAREDESVEAVTFSATRGGTAVAMSGDFTFSAIDGSVTLTGTPGTTLTAAWDEPVSLTESTTAFLSMFPTLKTGDEMTIKVRTEYRNLSFKVKLETDLQAGMTYTFPLTLTAYENNPSYAWTDEELPREVLASGDFTCATYNVDGLPNISLINPDGPGKDGTILLAQTVNNSNWDFFGVSEDFEFNDQLVANLTNYSYGTYRKATLGVGTADTDGLNFFFKKTAKISNETIVEFKESYGGLTSGANTSVKKGFRYYLVTLADGTEVDVYITHMNTYSSSGSGHINAQHAQLTQIADYIIAHQNGRPIIFMGDTNMRYTRHKIKELLIDKINAQSNLEITDPWVSLAWNNDFSSVKGDNYPPYPSNSLMVSDATGTSNTDIIISEAEGGLQKGEVVDKVFYINCKNSKTKLEATQYLRDTSFKKSNGSPLADHYPIVVKFRWTKYK